MAAKRAAPKNILCLHRHGPYGTVYAQEGLEVAMITGAFEQHIALALVDDGVFLLRRGQDTHGLEMKRFTAAFGAAGDFGVRYIYVESESLAARGMSPEALVVVPEDSESGQGNIVQTVSSTELSEIIGAQDVILNF